MSEANVRIVQNAYADFGLGNVAGILAVLDENVEWIIPGDVPESGMYRGPAEVANFFQLVGATWDFQAFAPQRFVASGDEVVALGMYTATSRRSGKQITADWAMSWRFRNGKVVKFQEFADTLALHYAAGVGAAA